MSSIDALHKKLLRLIATIDARATVLARDDERAFNLSLFSDGERSRFEQFFEQITPHITVTSGRADLSRLRDQELDQLSLWLELHRALESGDQAHAEQIRRWLSWSRDDLIHMFLEIDRDQIDDKLTGCYPLNETGYRNLVINHIARDRFDSSTLEYLRAWCDLAYVAAD